MSWINYLNKLKKHKKKLEKHARKKKNAKHLTLRATCNRLRLLLSHDGWCLIHGSVLNSFRNLP